MIGSMYDVTEIQAALLKFMWVRNWLKGLQEAQ